MKSFKNTVRILVLSLLICTMACTKDDINEQSETIYDIQPPQDRNTPIPIIIGPEENNPNQDD